MGESSSNTCKPYPLLASGIVAREPGVSAFNDDFRANAFGRSVGASVVYALARFGLDAVFKPFMSDGRGLASDRLGVRLFVFVPDIWAEPGGSLVLFVFNNAALQRAP